MKKIVFSVFFLGLIAIACYAADLTGTYKGFFTFQGERMEITYQLKAEGESLSGVVVSPHGELPLLDGKVKGNDFTFKVDIGQGPEDAKGKFYGDSIVVSTNIGGQAATNTYFRVKK